MNDYVKELRRRGWTARELAERWGVSPRRISQISANPSLKDWDALKGLPEEHDQKLESKSERDVLIEAASRIDAIIDAFTSEKEITISAYYDITVTFDDDGNITGFDTHP